MHMHVIRFSVNGLDVLKLNGQKKKYVDDLILVYSKGNDYSV